MILPFMSSSELKKYVNEDIYRKHGENVDTILEDKKAKRFLNIILTATSLMNQITVSYLFKVVIKAMFASFGPLAKIPAKIFSLIASVAVAESMDTDIAKYIVNLSVDIILSIKGISKEVKHV